MAPKLKKPRAVFPVEDYVSEDSETESEDSLIGQTINVDFEGFRAEDNDYSGICKLLGQTFRDLKVNISGIADIIISQNYVGSVIKQVFDDEDDDDDNEEEEMQLDDDDKNNVFGVTTILNLTARKEEQSIAELRTTLVEKCSAEACDATTQSLREFLGDESKHVGFLISERLVNLPPQFAVPVFDSLCKEIKESSKSMPYKFAYLIMIIKLYKIKCQKSNDTVADSLIWANSEEQIFSEESLGSFEYAIKGDSALGGEWKDDDAEYTPWRKIIIFEAAKLPAIVSKVRQTFGYQ